VSGERLRLERNGAVAELVFAAPADETNVLSMAAVDQMDAALDEIGAMTGIEAVVLRSAVDGVFVAGADVREIADVTDAAIAVSHSARVQSLFGRLERLPCSVVAVIDGACLGGGLELALACHLRVASDEPRTRLGLPEVKLGLIPGFGGTQRLPRLIGARRAVAMILKGYSLAPAEARAIGLIDAVLPAMDFEGAWRRWLDGRPRPTRRRHALADRLLGSVGPARDLFFWMAERRVNARTGGHYPAPAKALAAIREGLRSGLAHGLEVEAGLVGGLAVSTECKGLIRVFQLSEGARRRPGVELDLARPVAKVAVLGAGVMGAGIAGAVARKGIPVRLRDVSLDALARGMRRIATDRAGRTKGAAAVRLVSPTLTVSGFRRVDIVIEAALEDMALKRDLLEQVGAAMSSDAVYATNTSALSISELQHGLVRPERVVGMHFFNPVSKMPLVEVVRGRETSDEAVATAVQFALDLDKVPIVVADGPGFLVNRVLAPYLNEAMRVLTEGTDVETVDRAMRAFGLPMGPFEVLDAVGLDVARHVGGTLRAEFPERMPAEPLLEAMVERRLLGKKVGNGFYRHRRGRRQLNPEVMRLLRSLGARRPRAEPSAAVIQERLIVPMINEALRALEDGIVGSAGAVDLAMIMGAGFPPFRGGPLRFASELGTGRLLDVLERLQAETGSQRFAPAPLLRALHARKLSPLDARQILSEATTL